MLHPLELIKGLCACCLLFFMAACSNKEAKIEKKKVDGVEIILNRIEPYEIKGEAYDFDLEEEMVISEDRNDLVGLGMRSMGEFVVDSDRNIYIIGWKNLDNFIFKFNKNGSFITSFGRRGQGPGELEMPMWPGIAGGKLYLTDRGKKIVIYDLDGNLIEERYFLFSASYGDVLNNGKHVFFGGVEGYKTEVYAPCSLSLYDSGLRKIKNLDIYKLHYRNERLAPFFMWRVTKSNIFIINEERGYEILVYDLEGNLVRKIRKQYRPVPASKEIKMMIMGPQYTETGSRRNYVPDPLPPITFFEVDDDNRLFVMTYEKGNKPGEFMYDIFSPEGVFVGRKSLNLRWADLAFGVKYQAIKNNRLYCYRENKEGYMEMVVSVIRWKYR